MKEEYIFLSGNEACAEAAIKANLGFFAGYPITPSTEIAEILAERLPSQNKIFIQMEDEIASLAAVIGASIGGLKAMTATSGPGFSLMQEHIGFAVMAEISCVIVNVQRLGPSTGQPTSPSQGDVMQARWGTHGDHPIIALSPSSVKEVFDLTIQAFNLSEKYRIPVILLMDEVVAHMREKLKISTHDIRIYERKKVKLTQNEEYYPYKNEVSKVPALALFGEGYRFHITGLIHDQAGFPTLRIDEINDWQDRIFGKIENNLDEIIQYEEEDLEDAETVIISYGISVRSAQAAKNIARENGKKVGLIKLLTIWPFAEELIKKVSKKVKKIIMPELNRGQLVLEVERNACFGGAQVIRINRLDGKLISPKAILDKI
ncbi:MAG: 2-oxoacid:acceptor oxidoreductase subunit alpha [Armatimonadetes bacterium]|nr:2-oxoacid:acceptor oxidoreductase subunit alpha [Armatimonadota bacterium]